jgi:DNA-binding protein H-NS
MQNFSEYTLEQLAFLRSEIDALVRIRQAERIVAARCQILSIASRAGVPVEYLIDEAALPAPSEARRFRHPEHPELEWGGRGRHPRWIKELLDRGKSMEELRVT